MVNSLVYFRGGRKGEELYIKGRTFTLPVGGLISDIMDLNLDVFHTHMKMAIVFLDKIVEQNYPISRLRSLQNIIDNIPTSPVLRTVFLLQPLLVHQSAVEIEQADLMFTSWEEALFYEGKPTSYFSDQISLIRQNRTMTWQIFSDYLMGRETASVDNQRQQSALHKCLEHYRIDFEKLILDISRLKEGLTRFLLGSAVEKESAKRSLVQPIVHVSRVPYENCSRIFPKVAGRKYSQIYTATKIMQLIALELDLLEQSDQNFSRCTLCKRYFVPYKTQGVYCRNPNPIYENKRCCDIGPRLSYEEKIKALPHYSQFEKNKKAYKKWCRENTAGQEKEIIEEVNGEYANWENVVKKLLQKFYDGDISERELTHALMLPPVSQRSRMLHAKKQNIRRYNGNL